MEEYGSVREAMGKLISVDKTESSKISLSEARRAIAECEDREGARRLYDQLMDLTAQLARKFNFGRKGKRR